MKIKGVIVIEINEVNEEAFQEEQGFEDKDSVLAYLLDNPSEFIQSENVKVEISNVSWIEEPKEGLFDNEEDEEE